VPKIVDHDARRAEYLDALWRVVERDGAQAVTVRSVAAEAGLSKSNLGYYFASQDALLAAAVRQIVQATAAALDDLSAGDGTEYTPATAVAASLLIVPMTTERRRQAQVWLMLAAGHATDEAFASILAELNAVVRAGALMVVRRLAAGGFVSPARDLDFEAAALHTLLDGLSLQTVTDPQLMPDELVEQIVAAHVADLAR